MTRQVNVFGCGGRYQVTINGHRHPRRFGHPVSADSLKRLRRVREGMVRQGKATWRKTSGGRETEEPDS